MQGIISELSSTELLTGICVLAVYFGGLRGWENVFPQTGRKSASCRICPIKPTNIPEGGSTKGSLQQYTQFLPEDLAELKNSGGGPLKVHNRL